MITEDDMMMVRAADHHANLTKFVLFFCLNEFCFHILSSKKIKKYKKNIQKKNIYCV